MTQAIAAPTFADIAEAVGLGMEQAPCPVLHHFGPGIYIREVHLYAATDPGQVFVAVGRPHRLPHLNIMLRGRLTLMGDTLRELVAPQIFVAPPGRKVALVHEDVVWQNVIATELRDVEAIERLMFDDSAAFQHAHAEQMKAAHASREGDREDFRAFCAERRWSEAMVRELSELDADMADMPYGCPKFTVRASAIEGRGAFASAPCEAGEAIAVARLPGGRRTPAGRFVNHARHPNARFERRADGAILLVAARPIAGCCGGGQGEEITVDYRQAVAVALGGA